MDQRESFGSFLKSHREKKGIRLEEIASITKIHLRNLEYLELGQWNSLPPDPFLRGFIVAYAKYVGIDAKEAVQRFLQETRSSASVEAESHVDEKPQVEKKRAPSTSESRPIPPPADVIATSKTFPFKKIVASAAVVAVTAIFIFVTKIGQQASDEKVENPVVAAEAPVREKTTEPAPNVATAPNPPPAAPSAETKEATAPAAPVAPVVAAAPPAPAFAHEVAIEGKERTWIKVVYDKEPPLEYFLPEGEKVTYRAKEKIKVVLGNSTGTKITHNGNVETGTKLQGTIRQYIFPTDARFPQDAASRRAISSGVVDGAKPQPEKKPAPAAAPETQEAADPSSNPEAE